MQAVEIISITRYQPPTDPPPMMIDHLDFPLWQWFVYAACAIIVITATTLLICAVSFRPRIYTSQFLIPRKKNGHIVNIGRTYDQLAMHKSAQW